MCLFCVLIIFTMKPVAQKHLTYLKVAVLFGKRARKLLLCSLQQLFSVHVSYKIKIVTADDPWTPW